MGIFCGVTPSSLVDSYRYEECAIFIFTAGIYQFTRRYNPKDGSLHSNETSAVSWNMELPWHTEARC
jgi:hypothetical protein